MHPGTSTSPASERSLTGTESFAARLLRSERWRLRLMAAAMVVVMITVIVRRALGGVVMSTNAAFIPTMCVLILGLSYQVIALQVVSRRSKQKGTTPAWHRTLSAVVDLGVPCAVLLILQRSSPRGAYAALSGPSLLLLPLVIQLSILRLRPLFSLGTGMAAALMHLALVVHAQSITEIEPGHLPVLYGYGALIALTGGAAAVVSWMVRRYVLEAVEEATLAEKAQQEMALIQQDLRVARDIQMGLLPSGQPALNGFDFAGMARPAAMTGGDYYDWQALPDGRLVVVIADVTGHGLGPALVMAVCRAYARAAAPTSKGPDALLERINELIYEDVKGGRFITMVLAVISESGEVELVSAGHGPTLLFRAATSEVEWFGGDGLPLGVVHDESYGPRRTFQLQSGDVLVMLTDGFFEHMNQNDTEQFGVERLQAALGASASGSAGDIIAALDHAVSEFAAGAAQADDMTVVVIKRR